MCLPKIKTALQFLSRQCRDCSPGCCATAGHSRGELLSQSEYHSLREVTPYQDATIVLQAIRASSMIMVHPKCTNLWPTFQDDFGMFFLSVGHYFVRVFRNPNSICDYFFSQ